MPPGHEDHAVAMAQRLRLATGNIYSSARSRARDTANALVLDIGHVWQPAYLRGFCADHAAAAPHFPL